MNNDLTNLERTILRIEDIQYYTLCNIDTLIRIDEDVQVLSCKHCVFQDVIIDDYMVCPLKIIGELLLLK